MPVSPRNLRRLLLGITAGLVLTHVAFVSARYLFGLPPRWAVGPTFHFDGKANVPIWFSAVLLLLCSALLALIAGQAAVAEADRRRWRALSLVCLVLSLDEMSGAYDRLGDLLLQLGIPAWGWVLMPIVWMPPFALAYDRLLADLEVEDRRRLLVAAMVYLAGAVGLEILGAGYALVHGPDDLPYELVTTGERLLEMAGAILFLDALLRYGRAQAWIVALGES